MIREAPTTGQITVRLVCPRCHQTFGVVRGEKPSHYMEHRCASGPDIALIVACERKREEA